ncbi:hypothetical protein ATF69_1430 [Acidovorax delafieldii]|uniref:Uncharacterized protein n=1 Tax=Acidovorax delafieldii TaxID=47920 RepID=A0A561XTW8_ACIDE|nr:hypothetical protein ATF69_1430 [Acidovorax delafieldii]
MDASFCAAQATAVNLPGFSATATRVQAFRLQSPYALRPEH